MTPRLRPLLAACFLAGTGGGVLLAPRQAGTVTPATPEAAPAAIPARATVERAKSSRPESLSADEAQRLIRSLTPEDEWQAETTEALIRQLLADPAFINSIWKETPPDHRQKILEKVFVAIRTWCPRQAWRLVERIDFELPESSPPIQSALIRGVFAEPADGLAVLQASPSRIPRKMFDTLLNAAGTFPAGARLVLEEQIAGRLEPKLEATGSAVQTLMISQMTLPPGWDKIGPIREAAERTQSSADKILTSFKWAADGFPLEGLNGPGTELAERISPLLRAGKIPAPAVYDQVLRSRDPQPLVETLTYLADSSQLKEAFQLLDGMTEKPSGEKWDAELGNILSRAANQNRDRQQTIEFISRLATGAARDDAMRLLFTIWSDRDPQGALESLPVMENETDREAMRKRLEQNLLPPR